MRFMGILYHTVAAILVPVAGLMAHAAALARSRGDEKRFEEERRRYLKTFMEKLDLAEG